MKKTATEKISPYTFSPGTQPVIRVEEMTGEKIPANPNNALTIIGILLLAEIILLLAILLIVRAGQKIQILRQNRQSPTAKTAENQPK